MGLDVWSCSSISWLSTSGESQAFGEAGFGGFKVTLNPEKLRDPRNRGSRATSFHVSRPHS